MISSSSVITLKFLNYYSDYWYKKDNTNKMIYKVEVHTVIEALIETITNGVVWWQVMVVTLLFKILIGLIFHTSYHFIFLLDSSY